ncbi:hypothetical protein Naga_100106g10 [Nannochloropsis gaditana]|uniref:Uncharacterized protein n=1 Tax=Nannochloropsis gaditana TaxID=72520 RepID=W7U223_9STRA|nr:hypothetical protein Naga_100106g10 [Nannochloropsis gaditana]
MFKIPRSGRAEGEDGNVSGGLHKLLALRSLEKKMTEERMRRCANDFACAYTFDHQQASGTRHKKRLPPTRNNKELG